MSLPDQPSIPHENIHKLGSDLFWSHIDGALIINLDNRPDRLEQVRSQWERLPGHPPTLIRLSAQIGDCLPGYGAPPWFRGKPTGRRWAARAGCTQSHRMMLAQAKAAKYKCALLMEDDVNLEQFDSQLLADAGQALFGSLAPDWDVCYLGLSKTLGPCLRLTNIGERGHDLFAVSGAYTAHAYLIKPRALDWILPRLADNNEVWPWLARHRIIDRWYARHLSKGLAVVAISPSIATQHGGFSDIIGKSVNYTTEFSGKVSDVMPNIKAWRRKNRFHHFKLSIGNFGDRFRALGKRFFGF